MDSNNIQQVNSIFEQPWWLDAVAPGQWAEATVEKDGRIGEVKVVRGVDKDLDNEAKRVCKSLPKFSPGRNAVGDPVRVWYTLPVQFKLQGAN